MEFSLRKIGNELLTGLELSFGDQDIVKLNIDLNLSDRFEGDASGFVEPIKEISSFLAANLTNGIISIELSKRGQAGQQVALQVTITGVGRPEADVSGTQKSTEQLFKEFQGLACARSGKIKFEATEEKISAGFEIELKDAAKVEPKTRLAFQDKKVLIAEDNAVNIMVFSSFLRDWGILYSVVFNGQEAVDALKENNYDLVLMDIYMPVLNGIEAIAQLRKFNSKIPVVVLSASSFKKDLEGAMEAGANEFLKKPVTNSELFAVLSKFL
jgi:CheY-like chemotaxis protein